MRVSQAIAISISSILILSLMTLSTGLALAQRGDDGRIQLKADMVSGSALGKAYYQESGVRRRLVVQVENLPQDTQSLKSVFVDGVWVGNVTFKACPIPAQQLLCGGMELDTQNGQAVPVVTGGQTIQIGLSPTIIAGLF